MALTLYSPKNQGQEYYAPARIITYPDIQKKKLISLLTNDLEVPQQGIIAIYRWEMDDRDPFQATQIKLLSSLLLW